NPLLPNNKPEEQAKVLSLLGAIYEALGNYDKALEYQLKALENREKAGNAEGTAESLYKIGSMYFSQEKYDKSLEYYKKALHLCEKDISIPRKNLLNCLSAVGSAYEELGDQQESLR
ncbi:MAG TPA: tetratricopeptide repeat protein, partial [Saprospiraceae bacterium]|nr:tetratricopeptide repeat protein [Saprospiraceae bacterium]